MNERVVITGLGVVSPNAVGLPDFTHALRNGTSGIKFIEELKKLGFRCQVSGIPPINTKDKDLFLNKLGLWDLQSSGILYGTMAAIEAWEDAALPVNDPNRISPDWESGCIFGTGSNGIEASEHGIKVLESKGVDRSETRGILQALNSGVSSYIGTLLSLGNQVTSNASACNTGTEAILNGFFRITSGKAKRMLVGSSESSSPYVSGPFDAMFATAQGYNEMPEKASRPLSRYATGFVPSAGAGALVLESLSSARHRNAKIYAEVIGGHINSGGQRGNGTMTLGNTNGMVRCIVKAMEYSKIRAADIDLISGHLTSTVGDVREIESWAKALTLVGDKFPLINSVKSMIGHCLSAAGSIESVATILQLHHGFIHPSLNSENLHPEIEKWIDTSCVPQTTMDCPNMNIAAKISLGFGDINSCVFFRKWKQDG